MSSKRSVLVILLALFSYSALVTGPRGNYYATSHNGDTNTPRNGYSSGPTLSEWRLSPDTLRNFCRGVAGIFLILIAKRQQQSQLRAPTDWEQRGYLSSALPLPLRDGVCQEMQCPQMAAEWTTSTVPAPAPPVSAPRTPPRVPAPPRAVTQGVQVINDCNSDDAVTRILARLELPTLQWTTAIHDAQALLLRQLFCKCGNLHEKEVAPHAAVNVALDYVDKACAYEQWHDQLPALKNACPASWGMRWHDLKKRVLEPSAHHQCIRASSQAANARACHQCHVNGDFNAARRQCGSDPVLLLMHSTLEEQRRKNAQHHYQQRLSATAYALEETHDIITLRREEARQSAFNHASTTPVYDTRTYYVAQHTVIYLEHEGLLLENYTSYWGNQLNHVLHTECLEVLAQGAQLTNGDLLHDYRTPLALTADAARLYNSDGHTDKAVQALNFCHALLECGAAIARGVIDGTRDALEYCYDHPIETAVGVVCPHAMLAYTAGKLALAATGTAYDAATTIYHELHNGASTWDAFMKPLRECTEQWNMQDLHAADVAYYAARFTADVAASHKLQSGMQRVYSTACRNARAFRNAHPAAQVEDYLLTADGQLTMSLMDGNGGNDGVFDRPKGTKPQANQTLTKPSKYIERTKEHIFACEKSMEEFRAQTCGVKVLERPEGDLTHVIFGPEGLNHAFGIEKERLVTTNGDVEIRISGFHHDHLNEMQTKSIAHLHDKIVCPNTGYMMANLHNNDIVKNNKTFFPSHWTRKEVIDAILESLNDTNRKIKVQFDGKIIVEGLERNNVKIKTILNPDLSLKTSYPLLEKLLEHLRGK